MSEPSTVISVCCRPLLKIQGWIEPSPAAQASEYCNTNSSGMRGCGYSSLEQCQAAMSGQMGTCSRDPYYKDPKQALAYQSKRSLPSKRSRTKPAIWKQP